MTDQPLHSNTLSLQSTNIYIKVLKYPLSKQLNCVESLDILIFYLPLKIPCTSYKNHCKFVIKLNEPNTKQTDTKILRISFSSLCLEKIVSICTNGGKTEIFFMWQEALFSFGLSILFESSKFKKKFVWFSSLAPLNFNFQWIWKCFFFCTSTAHMRKKSIPNKGTH